MSTTVLVCLALIATASAGPMNVQWWNDNDDSSNSCALQCKSQPSKFQYRPDTTYSYDYAVDTETSMAGASEDTAQLKIEARVEIQSIDSCEFALTIKNVRVFHSVPDSKALKTADREDELRRTLERYNLRFSFDDGVIANVCPDSAESSWALNFKRGVLTAFQNSMENLDNDQTVSEADVTGECEAEYSVQKSWGWNKVIKITKSKNLVACSKRDGYRSFYQITPYKVPSEIQSLPILKGTHKCEYEVDSSRTLQSASCEENHVYAPFSNGESGGKTKVQQKMIFKNKRSGVDAVRDRVSDRRGLLFEHVNGLGEFENSREAAQQKLKEICQQTRFDIRPETPRLYSELVQVIKVLGKTELEQLYRLVKDKTICPENDRTLKFFLDALPMAGTTGPVGLMARLISDKEVEGVLAKAWIASLAIIQEPTSGMIEEGLKLLKSQSADDSLLPVSALVNNYCKKNPSCGDDYYASQVVEELQNKIPFYCQTDDSNLDNMLKTLRALGNLGQTKSRGLTSALNRCLNSDYAALEVKVAAADAYRRIPCGENDDDLWKALKNPLLDSELRITSYLAIMRCPSGERLKQISQALEEVEDEQLGSFIYSHLNNLKETSDPLKQDIAKAVSKLAYKEFDQNPLKNSANYEASFLINKLNLGLTADSNLIMSSNSPIPRSAMFNFTAALFGKSINILEVGGRAEGLEYLAERLLGPYGYFPDKSKDKSNDKLDDLTASLYARVFGNEVLFEHVKGAQDLKAPGKIPNFLDLLIKFANRQEVSYTHSQQLMDVSLIVPTVAGIPLNISVNGSINLDLKAEGKADLRRVSSSPRSLEIDGEFRPSMALEITGTMAVDAFITKMGLRMRNTMHSSTGVKGRIEINRGRELNIEIEPPRDKMEIFNAKSQFFIIHDQVEKEQDMIKDNRQEFELCSGDKLATIIGVELCGKLQFPNASAHDDAPYFPLTGPSSVSFNFYRRDTHTSYKLLAKRVENQKNSIAQFLMDTPNSKINRMISTDVTIGYTPDKSIDVILVSPWKKLNLNSAYVANKDIISVTGSVTLDDRDKYGLTTEVKINNGRNGAVFTPFIEITRGGKTDTLLSGQVDVDWPKAIDANLEFSGISDSPMTVKGNMVNSQKEMRLSTSLSNQGQNMYIMNVGTTIDRSGKDNKNIRIDPELIVKTPSKDLISIKGSADYKPDKIVTGDLTVDVYKMKPTSLTLKAKQTQKTKQSRYDVDLKVKSSLITGNLDTTSIVRRNMLASKIRLNYNIAKFGKDFITWNTKYNDRSKNSFMKYTISSNVDMKRNPDYNAGFRVDVDHKKKHSGIDVDIKYGADPKNKKKTIVMSTSLNRNIKNLKNADVDLKVSAQAPEKDIDFNMKMSHSHSPDKLESNVNLKFAPFIKNNVDAGLMLRDKSDKLSKYTGQANLGIMGRKFAVDTDLTQKSGKQYLHTFDITDSAGGKHSVKTVYKMPESNEHEITTEINVDGYKPVTLQGKAALDPTNFHASASAVKGNDVYSVSAQSKIAKDRAGKWSLELVHPDRQIQADVQGKNEKDKYSGSASLNWDAGRKNSKSVISVDGSYRHTASWDTRLINGEINVKTPFDNFEDLSADASYNSDPSQYNSKGKVSWGGKQDTISSSLFVKRPVSLKNVQITFMADTPFRQYREIELEVDHKMDPIFDSTVKGKLENDKAELTVKGENRGDAYSRNIYGLMDLKTPLSALRELTVSLEHKDDDRRYTTHGFLWHNGNKYDADLQMDHSKYGDSVVNNGNLKLTWPDDVMETSWKHRNDGTRKIQCSLDSTYSGNKRITVSLDGTNELNYDTRNIKGSVDIQTPYRSTRKINFSFDNKISSDVLDSSATLLTNGRQKAVYELLLESASNAKNAKFLVITPLYDQKVHGQAAVKYDSYPATAFAWLEWAPWARIDFDGSVNAQSTSLMSLDTKLTTPFDNFKNVIVKASHKLENSEYVTHAIIDYGVRKMIEFENRFRSDPAIQMLRTKLSTPCQYFKSLSTGVRLDTNSNGLVGSADFELLPQVNKYDGFFSIDYDDQNFNGKLGVNTPHRELPSLRVTSWSKKNVDSSRTSHIDVEPSPYGVYSLDTSYRTDSPYSLDVTVKTPHPEFDNTGLTLQYAPSYKGIQSKVRVIYPSNKEIDSTLNLDWSNNFEGSLLLTTPFGGYESNKVLARHDYTSSGCTSHGEVSIGRQNVQGDLVYTNSRSATSASASISSTLPGFESLAGKFNLNGDLYRLKGDASVDIGSDSLRTSFYNNMKYNSLKSGLSLSTPYTKDVKLSVQLSDSSSRSEQKYDSSFEGSYGYKSADAKLGVSYAGMENAKIDLSVNTPVKSIDVSIGNTKVGDKISGKSTIKSDLEVIGNIEISYSKSGPLENMVATANVIRNGESLIDTLVETQKPSDEVHGKVVTKGKWLPILTAEMDHRGILSDFNTKARLSGSSGNVFDNEVTFKVDGNRVDADVTLNYRLNNEDHTHTMSIHKEGTLNNFKVDISKKCDGNEATAKVELQTENHIKGLIHIDSLLDEYDLLADYDTVGIEFEHSGDTEKFLTSGKLILSSDKTIEGKVNFYRYELRRIEASAQLTTPFAGYEFSKIEYRHEGQASRFTCNMNAQYSRNQKISADMTMQSSPSYSMSFNVKTPFRGYEDLLLSGDFDSSKANGKAVFGKDKEINVSGVYDQSVYPYHHQYQITTPFDFLKKAILNLKGQPLDGTVDATVYSYDKKVDGNGALQYTSPYSMSVSTQLDSNIQGLELLKASLKNGEDSYKGKTSHLEVSWDPQQQVVVDGRYFSKESSWSGKKEYQADVDIKLPIEGLKSVVVNVGVNTETNKADAKLEFELNQDKLVDMDVTYAKDSKEAASAIIRKPWPMEYSVSRQVDSYKKDGEVYLNWNRDEPSSNLRVQGSMTDSPSTYSQDKRFSLALIRPSRTMGVEHSLSTTPDKLSSSGKLYWDLKDDSKLSYTLDINGKSRRGGDKAYDGVFKLGLPTRTLGVSGSVSNNELSKTADASFSWDLDRDDSKQIGVKASMSGQDYTKADVTLTLPANFQVDSKMTLNQGDTIFDGQTDISYTRDSRKTLTFYSKVKNVPRPYSSYVFDSGNGFNYSVELGVSHPDTKVDLTIDSHLGNNDERTTSSLGIKYLTFRRQMKILALFAEIDKIQKQINVVAAGPSSNYGVSGRVVSSEPLSLEAVGSVDGQEKIRSSLDLDKSRKTFNIEIGQPNNMVSFKAFYPNSSAVQAELNYKKDYSDKQEAVLSARLVNPRLLLSRFQWNPALLKELKDYVIQQTDPAYQDVKESIQDLNQHIETELAGKHRDITSSITDDLKPLLKYVEDELQSFGNDIDKARRKLNNMHRNNEFHLQDISEVISNNVDSVSRRYAFLKDELKRLSEQYKQSYQSLVQSLSNKLDEIKRYPIADEYSKAVAQAAQDVVQMLDDAVMSFIEFLRQADLNIIERSKAAMVSLEDIYSHPQLEFVREKVERLRNTDYSYYLGRFSQAMRDNMGSMQGVDLQPLKNVLGSVKGVTIDKIIPESVRDSAERASNEVYQQAKWAYNYWQVEDNLKKNTKVLIELLQEILEDELKQYINFIRAQAQNPIRVFDPENGVIETQLALPFELENLEEMPDLSSYINKASDLYDKYVPNITDLYPDSEDAEQDNSSEETSEDIDVDDDLSVIADDDDSAWMDGFEPSKPAIKRGFFRSGRSA